MFEWWLRPSGRAKEECKIPCLAVQVGHSSYVQLLKHMALGDRAHVGLHTLTA